MIFDARTIVLSISEKAGSSLPTAVFRDPVVSAQALEEALLGMAEHVRDHGFDHEGPYAAAGELLLAAAPAPGRRPAGTLRQPDEDLGSCLLRLCNELDGGVLPVQGPPGAGKTTQGARAILALAAQGKTHRHHRGQPQGHRQPAARRAGCRHRRRRRHGNASGPQGRRPRTAGRHPVRQVDWRCPGASRPGPVVGGTAWLWAHPDAIGCLDVLVIDEAGQMALAQALAAARASRNLRAAGRSRSSLSSQRKGAHEDGADVAALVHVLGPSQATLRPEQGLFLDTTYRLHPAICQFTSEAYYEGRCSRPRTASPADRRRHSVRGFGAVPGRSRRTRGTRPTLPRRSSVVTRVVRSLLQAGTTWTNVQGQTRRLEADDILVVAPYNAQVSALKRALTPLQVDRVGTVDKFQGQEAPVVIYSCTSSSPEDAPRGMAFLYDPHRFNVATSRARNTVIVVASPKLFEPDCRVPEQMSWANGFCRFAEMAAKVSL